MVPLRCAVTKGNCCNMTLQENAATQKPIGSGDLASMLTIGDMARRYGLTLRALRFYEDRGLVRPLRHGTTRFYDETACRRIEVILRGKHLGYTLTSIAAMLARGDGVSDADLGADAGEVAAQIDRLERKRKELDTAIAELRAAQSRAAGATAA